MSASGTGSRSRRAQLVLGAFGAEGSFSEEAAQRYVEREGLNARLSSSADLDGLFAQLADGALDLLCLPVVNSVGGLVRPTFEILGRSSFRPVGQVDLPVRHALLVRPGTPAARIRAVASHPQALVQCERYLERSFPAAERIAWSDTASAARELSRGELAPTTAVIASLRAARRFGLEALAENVQDVPDNHTTFLVLGRPA